MSSVTQLKQFEWQQLCEKRFYWVDSLHFLLFHLPAQQWMLYICSKGQRGWWEFSFPVSNPMPTQDLDIFELSQDLSRMHLSRVCHVQSYVRLSKETRQFEDLLFHLLLPALGSPREARRGLQQAWLNSVLLLFSQGFHEDFSPRVPTLLFPGRRVSKRQFS